jgi:hypothetical protein
MHVDIEDMLGKLPVSGVVALVQQEPEEVKAGEEGCREVDVLPRSAPLVVPCEESEKRVRD